MAFSKALGGDRLIRKRRALAAIWVGVLSLLFCGLPNSRARSAGATEYQVKAVFLFNFAQFVEWPSNAFADRNTPLVIGVLGQDPFGGYLEDTVRGETVKSRQLVTQRFRRIEDVKNCHILFISRSESGKLEQIVSSLRYRKILTVTDATGPAGHGVVIQFLTQQNRIKLRINVEAARAANLSISSKLLRLAEIGS